ncbi:hypothetical protein SSX86_015906 [Deinandra increscens subsp. villosa]|uniref:ATP-dependent DNA helicase n=1 Tax=Deinandra increscens subsp. villosa TaxID=3103831 RepID=A0AAP0D495_9ASTR
MTKRKQFASTESSSSQFSTTSTIDYEDLGDCNYVCEFCNATFWFSERLRSGPLNKPPKYTQCCRSGHVKLNFPLNPPEEIKSLFLDRRFMKNIRRYNSMFSMTSFGAKVDKSFKHQQGPYVFKVSGQISHNIGSLCPLPNKKPSFLQLYVYDTTNEVSNRLSYFSSAKKNPPSPDVVQTIKQILDTHNSLVKLFRIARDMHETTNAPNFSIRLFDTHTVHPYELPTSNTLGAIVQDDDPNAKEFDIIVRTKDNIPQRVNILHPSYMSLQYPLLFPFGEQGWNKNLRLTLPPGKGDKRLTMNMYYCFQIHDRINAYTLLLRGSKLFQQYLVDAYISIERNRLEYIESNQESLRSEFLSGVYDAISRGETEGHNIGQRIILPSSFTGGPRYMYKHYQDALAICRVHGKPQYFITFTCNAKWPEIIRNLRQFPLLSAEDRPQIIARVFQMKVESFITFLKEYKPFGVVAAELYTIEFQKRGLPHCHTLLWVTTPYKIELPSQVDNYISAEIPNRNIDPELYKIVTETLIHGPCSILNNNASCMRHGSCSKKFPKKYENETRFDDQGHIYYKRRQDSPSFEKNGYSIDCQYVVPYNRMLCLRFKAHINVEYCGWSMMIKYLFKYISKGADRIRYAISADPIGANRSNHHKNEPINEIKNFVDGRFICPHEASWRILNFPIHHRNPAVQSLSVHLEDKQNVTFGATTSLQNVVNNPYLKRTSLTEWLKNNAIDQSGRHLRYVDYLSEYKWDTNDKVWSRRKSKKTPSIGRLIYVHPSSGECFYLRLLLTHQYGCTSFKDIRTVSGILFPTYRAACENLGLLGDDREWAQAFEEASTWATASQLRLLFTHMLLYCEVSSPMKLWIEHWRQMKDDIVHDLCKDTDIEPNNIPELQLQQQILYELQKLLNSAGSSASLTEFGLPAPQGEFIELLDNRMLMEERCYDRSALRSKTEKMRAALNWKQTEIYNRVLESVFANKQIMLFIYGHGGTGKTFLWTTIINALRSEGKVVLPVAASGIASLLLPSGRTAHSRFRIPINITDESLCYVKKKTQLSRLLIETSLIIWDEAPMSDRLCLECLDRTLRDILDNPNIPFGGKSILLGGDFRQTLPVKKKSTKQKVIASSLPKSKLWNNFQVIRLTDNMRLRQPNMSNDERRTIENFSNWLVNIGDGTIGSNTLTTIADAKEIEIAEQYLLQHDENALNNLIRFIYDDNTLLSSNASAFSDKAIVCPKNITADEINQMVLDKAPGNAISYLSTDSLTPRANDRSDSELSYPDEYINSLKFSGIPPHHLILKVNTPIILIRNINQSCGMCNGTRMLITQLLPKVIEAIIITGTSIGQKVYIPRISFVHDDKELPFIFKRRQFPIKLCYAMTINKSQGQSLNKIGVYLPEHVFGHGQLYVALSRATSPTSLKILIKPEEGFPSNKTLNIVYSDLLNEIDIQQSTHIASTSGLTNDRNNITNNSNYSVFSD